MTYKFQNLNHEEIAKELDLFKLSTRLLNWNLDLGQNSDETEEQGYPQFDDSYVNPYRNGRLLCAATRKAGV